jgi:hypothetical protein
MGTNVSIIPTDENEVKVLVVHARNACEERIYSSTHS